MNSLQAVQREAAVHLLVQWSVGLSGGKASSYTHTHQPSPAHIILCLFREVFSPHTVLSANMCSTLSFGKSELGKLKISKTKTYGIDQYIFSILLIIYHEINKWRVYVSSRVCLSVVLHWQNSFNLNQKQGNKSWFKQEIIDIFPISCWHISPNNEAEAPVSAAGILDVLAARLICGRHPEEVDSFFEQHILGVSHSVRRQKARAAEDPGVVDVKQAEIVLAAVHDRHAGVVGCQNPVWTVGSNWETMTDRRPRQTFYMNLCHIADDNILIYTLDNLGYILRLVSQSQDGNKWQRARWWWWWWWALTIRVTDSKFGWFSGIWNDGCPLSPPHLVFTEARRNPQVWIVTKQTWDDSL